MYRIPNLCRNTAVFMALLVVAIVALVYTLTRLQGFSINAYSLSVMYIVWLVLASIASLCAVRGFVNQAPLPVRLAISLLIFASVFTLVELSAQAMFEPAAGALEQYLLRGTVVLMLGLLTMGFFSLLHKLELGARAETLSRLQALQSRIRPHFLFNSLNTVAELISVDSDKAEEAIHSLSLLFRASLDDVNDQHTLDKELRLCRGYIDLERWRLGDRLDFEETVAVELENKWYVPKLILQPLLENAIVHGVHAAGDGGKVVLDIRDTKHHLSLKVSNSKPEQASEKGGAGIAIDNIRERLLVLYDDDHYFKTRDEGELYSVVVRLPKRAKKVTIQR